MNLATFRAAQPIKSTATYRPLDEAETAAYLRGDMPPANVCAAAYLRMTVTGAESVADGLYYVTR